MTKKIFTIISIILALVFLSSVVFANNNLGSEMQDSINKAGNTVKDMGNHVMNGIDNMKGDNKNNGTALTRTNNGDGMGTTHGNNGYTATRTATAGNIGFNSTTWTWVVLAIAGIVIVSLVWYYATQSTKNQTRIRDDEE